MDRLGAMTLLVATVEAGSFSAASRNLRIPLPSISRKIAELERHLGTRLLVRSTRRLAPTEAGAAYLAQCRRILELVGEAEAQAAGEYAEPRGELIVTAPIAFGRLHVLPVATEFLAAHPRIDIRLHLADRNLDLIDAHIDVAVRIGELPDSRLVATRIGTLRRIVCASPAYLAAHGEPRVPQDLAAHDAVTFSSLPHTGWRFGGSGRSTLKAGPRCRLAVDTAEAAIDATRAGIGLTQVLSYQAAAAIAAGELVEVLADFATGPIPIHVLHAGQGLLPLKTRGFLDTAIPALRRRLGAS